MIDVLYYIYIHIHACWNCFSSESLVISPATPVTFESQKVVWHVLLAASLHSVELLDAVPLLLEPQNVSLNRTCD